MLELKNLYQKKGKRYLHYLFMKRDPEHLELGENVGDYLENDGLEDTIRNENKQNLNVDD